MLSSASSSLRRHLLLSLHREVGAAHSDVRTAPSAFCCNSQRERNEKKARRSETERGRGRWGEKMEKLCQSNAGEKMGVNKRDGGALKRILRGEQSQLLAQIAFPHPFSLSITQRVFFPFFSPLPSLKFVI